MQTICSSELNNKIGKIKNQFVRWKGESFSFPFLDKELWPSTNC